MGDILDWGIKELYNLVINELKGLKREQIYKKVKF